MRMTAINPNVKVKEIRTWNNMDFSLLMLRKGWKEPDLWVGSDTYAKCFIRRNKPTNKNIYALSKYLLKRCIKDERETVERVMHWLFIYVVRIEFKVEEGE